MMLRQPTGLNSQDVLYDDKSQVPLDINEVDNINQTWEAEAHNKVRDIIQDDESSEKLYSLLGTQKNEMNPVLYMFLQDQVFDMM